MQQARRNGTPAYKRIQSTILKRIEHGHLKPGDAVGSERELARVHKVSLMTARHALAGLERDGIVERRPGAGTFVAPPKIHFNKLMSYTEQMSSRGLIPCSDILCLKLIEGDPEIAARLGLNASAPLVKLERVRHTATEPFAPPICHIVPVPTPKIAARTAIGSHEGRRPPVSRDRDRSNAYRTGSRSGSASRDGIDQTVLPSSAPVHQNGTVAGQLVATF